MTEIAVNPFDDTDEALQQLLNLPPEQAVQLFSTLGSPVASTVAGEYAGRIGNYLRRDWDEMMAESGLGRWLGKGYRGGTAGDRSGEGYNIYSRDGQITRSMRFSWHIGPSTIGSRPALMMHYSAFDNWAGKRDLVDELRIWRDDVLLGVFHTDQPVQRFTAAGGGPRSAIGFFVLKGSGDAAPR